MRTFAISSVLALGVLAACEPDAKPSAPQASTNTQASSTAASAAVASAPAAHDLTAVTDASQVCMVTNQYMGVPQIPVEVEGKTYFGCCEMCKTRLANEPGTRLATDPVTGQTVDKATAVIAKQSDGKLVYFASADTFSRYRGL